MYIVLTTRGLYNEIYFAKVTLFENFRDAERFCIENSVDEDEKDFYWTYSEIIKNNVQYEINHCENIPCE